MKAFIFGFFISICFHTTFAQTNLIGNIFDSNNSVPIPFARVYLKHNKTFAISNLEGKFTILISTEKDTLEISCVGYNSILIPVTNNIDSLRIELESNLTLKEVDVFARKKNPAFRILKAIKDNEKKNNPNYLESYEYEVYNTLQFDLTNINDKFKTRSLIKGFEFITDYMDTSNSKNYLPIVFTESVSDFYFHKFPKQKKEIIKATRVTGFNNLQLERYTGQLHQNFSIYDNFIDVFNTDFMGPLALGGRVYYNYKLIGRDTVNSTPCYRLKFDPKRKGDPLFKGEFWVSEYEYAIIKVSAYLPDLVNINYVSGFNIEQLYKQINKKAWFVYDESVQVDFKIFNETKKALLFNGKVNKQTTRKKILINQPRSSQFYVSDISILDSAKNRTNSYWNEVRHDSLNEQELGIINMHKKLNNNRLYKFYKKSSYFGYTGFWQAGPIEIGNIYSIYNKNLIEGDRIMLSLRTSNKFSRWHEFSLFGIYGFADNKYKYGASYRWKFKRPNREILRFAYKKRIEQLSLSSSLGDIGNSFSTLFSAGIQDKLTLIDQYSVNFEKDWSIDLRTFNAIEWKRYTALASSDYKQIIDGDTTKLLNLTSFQIRNQIMYTSEEKFISGSFERFSLGSKKPIVSLTHTFGIKDLFDSDYQFHRLDFVWDHRPKIGVFGRLHYSIYFGKIFGTLPFPFLNIHQGNQTFYLQPSSMNLLNYYEFISDIWLGANFEHRLKGLILDRVPIIRRLKWRLLYGIKAVVGSLDDKHNSELIIPEYSNQLKLNKPYTEVNIGVENILKFIRIDALWRLSYNYHQDISKFGVKFTFTGDF